MWPFSKSLEKIARSVSDKDLISVVRNRAPKKYDAFSDIQKGVNAAWSLRAETLNGTIEQYFANSSGDYYPLVCDFLRLVGADSTLAVLTQFGRQFGEQEAFPSRSARIDYITHQEEVNPDAWRIGVRQASCNISDTFEDMTTKVADFLRNNLSKIEPNRAAHPTAGKLIIS